jgi:hypothetical protein
MLFYMPYRYVPLLVTTALVMGHFSVLPAHAEQIQTLVIADTAIDSSLGEFSENIIQEVCIVDYSMCPNGTNFMEGKGSAYLPKELIQSNGFNHGTQMVSAAVRTNPDLRIIFIRIVSHSSKGLRLTANIDVLKRTLDWVIKNRSTYNIQAIAVSQGHSNLLSLSNYCPQDDSFNSLLHELHAQEVPYFAPTGNRGDRSRVDWPACTSTAVAIGALTFERQIASYSNIDNAVIDHYEIGTLKVLDASNREVSAQGTSVSVQVAAAKWMKIKELNPNITISESLEQLRLESGSTYRKEMQQEKAETPAVSPFLATGEFREIFEALRGLISQLQNLLRLTLKNVSS